MHKMLSRQDGGAHKHVVNEINELAQTPCSPRGQRERRQARTAGQRELPEEEPALGHLPCYFKTSLFSLHLL